MIEDIQKMMDGYLAWLKDKTSLREVGDWSRSRRLRWTGTTT
jgi:hypothetical protein